MAVQKETFPFIDKRSMLDKSNFKALVIPGTGYDNWFRVILFSFIPTDAIWFSDDRMGASWIRKYMRREWNLSPATLKHCMSWKQFQDWLFTGHCRVCNGISRMPCAITERFQRFPTLQSHQCTFKKTGPTKIFSTISKLNTYTLTLNNIDRHYALQDEKNARKWSCKQNPDEMASFWRLQALQIRRDFQHWLGHSLFYIYDAVLCNCDLSSNFFPGVCLEILSAGILSSINAIKLNGNYSNIILPFGGNWFRKRENQEICR